MMADGKHVFAHFNLVFFFFCQTSSTSFAFKHGGVGLYLVSNSKCVREKSLKLFRNIDVIDDCQRRIRLM